MSESEIPNSSADPIETPANNEGWTTVNFPNAIEVESIPGSVAEPSQIGIRVKDLEQQNQRLRSRVAELEFSLGEAHATLRADTKRLETQLSTQQAESEQRSLKESQLSQQQTVMIAKQRQALDASRQRLQDQEAQLATQLETIAAVQAEVTQLNQTLDQAHQVQQKQQILIETLTTQLESSQTQVAQLERDCALTKQQYDEQIQQLRQSESAGRDLRSRLHRQQQYTLQFKAALEKCLDVSTTQKIEESVDQAISEIECKADPVEFVRAQPVQPWSTTLENVPTWSEPELTPSAWSTAPDEENLFEPEASESVAEEASVELDYDQIEQPEPIQISPPLSYTIKRSTEETAPIHANLDFFAPAQAEPDLATPVSNLDFFAPTPAESENFVVSEPIVELDSIPEVEPMGEIAATPSLALPPAAEPVVPTPSPFITLTEGDRIRRDEPVELPPMGESPSPVVYPQRSQKKLESLAAVELPTFPKK